MKIYDKILKEGGELMNILFASLISADNEELEEETKQEMISRYQEQRKTNKEDVNWEYITEPMDKDKKFQEALYKAAMESGE